MALQHFIRMSQPHSSTYLGRALMTLAKIGAKADRMIVVTDEQAHDNLPAFIGQKGYILNVAPYKPALPTSEGGWVRLNGWSERVVDWIRLEEATSTPE
jgi:hypothetical protein